MTDREIVNALIAITGVRRDQLVDRVRLLEQTRRGALANAELARQLFPGAG